MLVQFKDTTKYAGKTYRQNQRVDFQEATAARLVSLGVAELPGGRKGSPGFEAMVSTFRESRVKKAPPRSKEARAGAEAERAAFREGKVGGPRCATQFG